jgi:hypothetical protein
MSSSRIRHLSTTGDGRTAARIVWWVGGWSALAVVVHLVYLPFVFPMIDHDLVLYLTGKNASGGVFTIDAHAAAVVATIALAIGAAGAGIAVAIHHARPLNAHQVAVLALALVAGSLALDAAGLIAAVVDGPIAEPGLASGTPQFVAAVVFVSQLVPLFVGKRGRRVQAAV